MRAGWLALILLTVACNPSARRPSSASQPESGSKPEVVVPTVPGTSSAQPSPVVDGAVEAAPDAATADRQKSASSRTQSGDGTFMLSGRDGHARHTHGGPPAHLGSARFHVENTASKPRRLRMKAVEALHSGECASPSRVTARPALGQLEVDDQRAGTNHPKTEVEIPAGAAVDVIAYFAPVEAYMAWCDRFAFRVEFELDGSEPLSAVAETFVARVTPLRPP